MVASGSRDGTIKRWDLATGRLLHTMRHYLPFRIRQRWCCAQLPRDRRRSFCGGRSPSPDSKMVTDLVTHTAFGPDICLKEKEIYFKARS